MKKMFKNFLSHKTLVDVCVLLLITFILFLPMFRKVNVYHDDGIQHISRAYGTYVSFGQNGIFNKIINSFANEFGYSWDYFYGPLTTWGIILIYFVVRNFIRAYKILCFILMFLSGLTMYKLMKKVTDNRYIALLTGILYMSFPYHLTDLYYRNALGEFISFVFIPLVFLGIYNLVNKKKGSYFITIGAVGLVLSHNLSTVLVAIFALLYLVFNIEKLSDSKVRKVLILNIVYIILITAMFWMPLLEARISASYQVYVPGFMGSTESVSNRGLKIQQLFVTQKEGYVFELGPHFIIMLALSVWAHRRIDKKYEEFYVVSLASALICLVLSTKYFPWKWLPEIFGIIQFPWRFLMMAAFFISIVSVLNIYSIVKKFGKYDVAIISLLSIIYMCAFYRAIPMDLKIVNVENFIMGRISGKEDETVIGTAKAEYLPVDAYNNRFYIATREDNIYVIEGSALIENEIKENSSYKAHVTTYDCDFVFLELPYIYYPGYKARLDGMVTKVYQTKNGFCGVLMPANDDADLYFYYDGSIVTKISYIISIAGIVSFSIYTFKRRKVKEESKKVRTIKLVNNLENIVKTENKED